MSPLACIRSLITSALLALLSSAGLFAQSGGDFQRIKVVEPTAFVATGGTSAPGANDAAMVGNILYVAHGNGSSSTPRAALNVYNVADPANPVLVRELTYTDRYFSKMLVDGNFLLVVGRGLTVFDIRTPANPLVAAFHLTTTAAPAAPNGYAIESSKIDKSGNFLFLDRGIDGVMAVNVANLTSTPVYTGKRDMAGSGYAGVAIPNPTTVISFDDYSGYYSTFNNGVFTPAGSFTISGDPVDVLYEPSLSTAFITTESLNLGRVVAYNMNSRTASELNISAHFTYPQKVQYANGVLLVREQFTNAFITINAANPTAMSVIKKYPSSTVFPSSCFRFFPVPNLLILGGDRQRFEIHKPGAAPPAAVAPAITTQPVSVTVAAGGTASFSVVATGTPAPTYQWRKDGTALSGATEATLRLSSVAAAQAGNYTVVVTNSAGSVTSSVAGLALTPASVPPPSRLSNLSILTGLATSGDSFTMGYVVGGVGTTDTKPLVIRAAGPSLGALGVTGTLDDPKIQTFAGSTATGENDNWGGATNIATAMASVGAFAYAAANSRDAAIATSVASGDNSVKVLAAGSGTGAVIAEIYDATPEASFTAATPRLINVSVLKHVGQGLTAGFVVAGTAAKNVLIRAVGPGLAAFGVAGLLADPKLELFDSGSRSIATNDNWGGTAALSAGFTQVGAFQLAASSRDAALLASLSPGNYTVLVNGVGNTTGVALIEVYEVP